LVEHVIRNDGVTGSSPVCGTIFTCSIYFIAIGLGPKKSPRNAVAGNFARLTFGLTRADGRCVFVTPAAISAPADGLNLLPGTSQACDLIKSIPFLDAPL
jgi:hypothetical protein